MNLIKRLVRSVRQGLRRQGLRWHAPDPAAAAAPHRCAHRRARGPRTRAAAAVGVRRVQPSQGVFSARRGGSGDCCGVISVGRAGSVSARLGVSCCVRGGAAGARTADLREVSVAGARWTWAVEHRWRGALAAAVVRWQGSALGGAESDHRREHDHGCVLPSTEKEADEGVDAAGVEIRRLQSDRASRRQCRAARDTGAESSRTCRAAAAAPPARAPPASSGAAAAGCCRSVRRGCGCCGLSCCRERCAAAAGGVERRAPAVTAAPTG